MTITPSGKLRVMEAQKIANDFVSSDLSQQYNNAEPIEDSPVINNTEDVSDNQSMASGVDSNPVTDTQEGNLSDYLFKIYTERFGFESRILRSLKKDFVMEEINPDQTVNITITLPAYYWKTGEKIGSQEAKKIIDEVSRKFKLFHTGSKIGDEALIINLTSSDEQLKSKDGDDEMNTPYLDKINSLYDIYGKQPPGMGVKKSPKGKIKSSNVQTLPEMIKESTQNFINKISKEM